MDALQKIPEYSIGKSCKFIPEKNVNQIYGLKCESNLRLKTVNQIFKITVYFRGNSYKSN